MASQEEDNKLECISNVNKEQERYYLNVYKKYDSILNDKAENFENKVTSLIEVWSSISDLNLSQFDIRYVIQIIDWAKLHALNIVLTGEWRTTKESFRNSLLESIEKAQSSLVTVNDAFSSRCQKLADVVKKPWEDPVLANLIQEKEAEIGSKEIEFFCVETAYLVSVRLKKLCENHCEDLALNLVTNFLKYKKLATVKNFNLNATETQLWFIFDIYIALLYKFQDKVKILEQFEELQLGEGVLLIKRFAKKRVKISKIWRNCQKIAVFGSRFFMSRALMKYTDEFKDFLTELLKTYLALSTTDNLLQEFVLSVRNITNLADAAGLCVMCEVIHREAADKLRVFAIEMYIRALTTDMNELERLKHVNEDDKVKLTTSRLAKTFTNLADLLDDHVKVARECVLTAFSLEPTKDRIKRLEDLARRSGFPVLDTGQEWKCQLHPPVLPTDDLAWVCPECGEWMCKPELTAPLQMNMALHEALQESVLGISEALCDDLVVCLSNPRYQILSWRLDWCDLYRLCILYLNDPEKTKNFVTELKFVDVDYSMFEHIKREPVDEYTGIEKGYEQYLDLDFVSDEETSSVSEDSMSHDRSVGLGSDGAGEPHLTLPQPKSDPVTLKSLRMFRPNLKRKKDDCEPPAVDKKAPTPKADSHSSASSLGNYLSSTHYKPQSEYSTNIPATNRMYTTPSVRNKTPSSNTYLPQAAGVTKQSTKSNSSQVSAASNFSAFGYSSTYAAKSFEVPKQPKSKFTQANPLIQTSFKSNVSPICYPGKISEAKKNISISTSTIIQPENSVFNTTNLSSASSTSYVSNIIKSTLSYGVPKVSVTGSTYASAIPTESITNSHSFGSMSITKQALLGAPKQVSFSTAQKNTTPHPSSFASQNNLTQNAFTPHGLTLQKNTSQHTANSAVPDLDALLNEIDTNKYETDSKNGVAATLLQLGGQVAKNQKQTIQVSEQLNLNQIPTKLPQETSLPNGTKKECKMKLKNSTNPDKSNPPGAILEQAMEPLCKQRKLTNESNSLDAVNLPGITTFKAMDLRVKIPKLNLEKFSREAKSNLTGIITDKRVTPQTPTVLPVIQGSNIVNPSAAPKSPLEHIAPTKAHQLQMCQQEIEVSIPLTRCNPPLDLKLEPSTLPQDKLPSQIEVPTLQVQHQARPATKQESRILTCPKEQSSMPLEQLHQQATVHTGAKSQLAEPQLKVVLSKEHCQVPRHRRLESVIIVHPLKAKRIISQALLQPLPDKKLLLQEPVSEPLSASISLVKNRELPETTSTCHSLLKAGDSRSSKISSQFTKKTAESPKKCPTTYTPADSLKTITPITVDCDKDKKVQIDNQKTDIEMTEVRDDATFSTAEDNNNCCVSQVSSKKTDEQISIVKDNKGNQMATKSILEQISEEWAVSNTQNIIDSIIIDSDLASDNIRLENKTGSEKLQDSNENTPCKSNKEDDISTENVNETINKSLKEDDQAINGIKTVDIVNNKIDCDKVQTNVVENVDEKGKTASGKSKPVKKARKRKRLYSTPVGDSSIEAWLHNYQRRMARNEAKKATLKANAVRIDANKMESNDKMLDKELEVTLEKHKDNSNLKNTEENSSQISDAVAEATNDTLECEIPIAESVTIQECDESVVPTVNEIKENILQSMHNQEVIREQTDGKRKHVNCGCREDNKIKIGQKEPYEYVQYMHNYCGTSKTSPKASKREIPQSFQNKKPMVTRSKSKSRSRLYEIEDNCLLFTDSFRNCFDFDKENISSDNSEDEELDTDIKSATTHCTNSGLSRLRKTVKIRKYSNTHKRKHKNVACFKVDQEKDSCDSSDNSNKDKFKAKELSVMLHRLPNLLMRRCLNHRSETEPFHVLQARIYAAFRMWANSSSPICVWYNKPRNPVSPLLDLNVRNQIKPRADYVKKNVSVKKKAKPGILKKKYGYPSRQPKTTKHVRFEDKARLRVYSLYRNELKAKSMLKNVPGLNDFSEVRPRYTEHVVNVVQVSGSRSSTVTNQNTQTSTQVTPHIQRIGQPKQSERLEEQPEQSVSSSATTSRDSHKPAAQNRFGGQMKPGQKSSGTSKQAPLINILSQQILKQPGKPSSNHIKPCTHSHHHQSPPPRVITPEEEKLVAEYREREANAKMENKTATVKVEPEENADVHTSKSINTNVKIVTSTTQACGAAATASSSTQGGTILQFICKSSSLPKFQQAFGKAVYQSNNSNEGVTETAGTPASENSSPPATVVDTKKIATKAVPVNVQPITGNVIFRGQVPVGQTVSLIPPGSNTRQLFRITGSTHEQISLVKETVIQNKMSALLAAALQGKPKITEQNGELVEEYSATRITLCRPGTVPPNATRIVKPVQLQIPANVIRAPQPNLSSTTLEQLREFDMVYKQVKERSSNPAQPETTVQSSQESPQQQRISFTYVNQVQKYTQLSPVVVVSSYSPIQQTVSPAMTVTSQTGAGACLTQVSTVAVPKVAVKTSKGKNIKSSATKISPTAVPTIPKPQQKPQEDEHTTQRIFDILAEYAEQLRNSPDLNNKPAPRRRSNPPTNPSSSTSGSSSSKKKKKKSSSSTTSNLVETDNEDLTMGSEEDSSGGNIVQLSMTDEEQSQSASITPPETNLEPAMSNTPTSRSLIVTDTSNHPRNVIIADSSVGEALKMPNTALIMPGSYIMPVSVVKGGQQIAVVSGGSKILTTVPARSGQNMLLFQSFVNQNKKGGISTVKYSTIQPFSGISSQNVAGISSQAPVVLPSSSVATVSLGQPITLKKLDDNERGTNTELLLTISHPRETIKVEQSQDIPQPDSSTSRSSDSIEVKIEEGCQSDSSSNEVFNTIQKTNSVATSVIASVVKKEQETRSENSTSADTSIVKVEEPCKQVERIGSVLVNASTSNGPMLSHTNPRYRKPVESVQSTTAPTKEFNHNVTKVPPSGTKVFKNAVYYAIRTKKAVGKKIDSEMQKQAAMEREIRLQKSLSEECEDLGVDEPSTSDLFPEADLLFDSNHSPSYDHTGQRIQVAEGKGTKASMHLFSDDENSGPMRHDLFDYVEYHPAEVGVDQMNGNNASNESASSCDDTTLLSNCGTMSEVTLNSPISPEYTDNIHIVNKYKYKYTNRKKGEKTIRSQVENWSEVTEVSSTGDTIEIAKEEDETPIAIQEETVIDDSVTEVEAVVDKFLQEKELTPKCPVHGSTDTRGSTRKHTKKPCSCFNGSKSPNPANAKRRVSSPKCQTPAPNKKPLLSKKR